MKYALSLAALAAVASGHSIFGQIVVGGTQYPLGYAIRAPSYNGPILDVTTADLACNGGPNPTTSSPYVLDVVAGSTVKAVWRHSVPLVIDASHKGPVMAYMKKVDNAATDSGVGSGWFKIAEAGYNAATGTWAVDDLIAANGFQDITIPKCIPNGQYLLRAELIALHAAGSSGQAQFYMECAQINVTGGTGGTPAPTVSLPGAYSATDPGILINIYPVKPPYVIPGPRPYTCGGTQPTTTSAAPTSSVRTSSTSSATTTRVSTTLSTTTRVSTTASTTTKAATTTSASSGGTGAPLYGQCGGGTWAGPFTCAAGTCVAQSQWYSQCLP